MKESHSSTYASPSVVGAIKKVRTTFSDRPVTKSPKTSTTDKPGRESGQKGH
jgi:hypothetical protein